MQMTHFLGMRFIPNRKRPQGLLLAQTQETVVAVFFVNNSKLISGDFLNHNSGWFSNFFTKLAAPIGYPKIK